MKRTLRIGLSCCLWHEDPTRKKIFNGRPLVYAEESLVHYLASAGASVFLLPTSGALGPKPEDLLDAMDGLVLHGGVDISPESYGETPIKDEWKGDRVRDLYELRLLETCIKLGKPVLGICRGAQLINVFFGGSLYQDIRHFAPDALIHRSAEIYEKNNHSVTIKEEAPILSRCYPGTHHGFINSVHHQGLARIGKGLIVEAFSTEDGIPEAVSLEAATGHPFCLGVQWHPEFQGVDEVDKNNLLSSKPILASFMDAMLLRKE